MAEKQSPKKSISSLILLWRFFSSLRLALILMLVLIGLSLIGTFVIQAPPLATSNPSSFNQWLQFVAQPQTGFWFPILRFFDFFNVFHSLWFLGSGALLVISIIICSLNRLRRIRINISSSPVNRVEGFYKTEDRQPLLSITSEPAETVNQITRLLKKRHYSVRQESASEGLYLAADKNRFSPLGTYIIHLSLILLIIGYLIGSYMGFKDTSFIVPEGVTKAIGYNTGLSLHLNSFTDEYWPDGTPKEYRSDVEIIENNQVVKTAAIEVNHPLDYKGIRVYQSFFGPAVQIQLNDTDGKQLFNGFITLPGVEQDYPYMRPSGMLTLQNGYILYVVDRATNIKDTVLNEGQVGFELYKSSSDSPLISTILSQGVPYKSGNMQVTYSGNSMFSGFEITHDPGTNLIWIASGLFLLGLVFVFYLPRRRIWAFVESIPGQGSRLWLRSDAGHKPGAASDLQGISQEIKRKSNLTEKETL